MPELMVTSGNLDEAMSLIQDEIERIHAMQQMEEWATKRGIQLMNPRDSEYRQLVDKMDK